MICSTWKRRLIWPPLARSVPARGLALRNTPRRLHLVDACLECVPLLVQACLRFVPGRGRVERHAAQIGDEGVALSPDERELPIEVGLRLTGGGPLPDVETRQLLVEIGHVALT